MEIEKLILRISVLLPEMHKNDCGKMAESVGKRQSKMLSWWHKLTIETGKCFPVKLRHWMQHSGNKLLLRLPGSTELLCVSRTVRQACTPATMSSYACVCVFLMWASRSLWMVFAWGSQSDLI